MNQSLRTFFLLSVCSLCLTGCISTLWTGAGLVYDRHNVYLKVNDFQLGAEINRALYHDKRFKRQDCAIEVAVFRQDVLLSGRVPTKALRQEAYDRISQIPGKRRLFNQLDVSNRLGNPIQDSFITAQIRGQILADADIDPGAFKIVTSDQIVYLMGNVLPEQASKVILFARKTDGVKRVVNLFKYYHLSDKPTH